MTECKIKQTRILAALRRALKYAKTKNYVNTEICTSKMVRQMTGLPYYFWKWHGNCRGTASVPVAPPTGVPPTKFGTTKNVWNSARFLTTLDFDREYLRNGSTYRKSEKYLINYISSPIGRKTGELWSTNQKVIDAHVDPPKWNFFGILNFGR